jgi:hypothetical protein
LPENTANWQVRFSARRDSITQRGSAVKRAGIADDIRAGGDHPAIIRAAGVILRGRKGVQKWRRNGDGRFLRGLSTDFVNVFPHSLSRLARQQVDDHRKQHRLVCSGLRNLNSIGAIIMKMRYHVFGIGERICDRWMSDAAGHGSEPAGNGSSNSIESGAVRYELSLRNRTSSFDERQPA